MKKWLLHNKRVLVSLIGLSVLFMIVYRLGYGCERQISRESGRGRVVESFFSIPYKESLPVNTIITECIGSDVKDQHWISVTKKVPYLNGAESYPILINHFYPISRMLLDADKQKYALFVLNHLRELDDVCLVTRHCEYVNEHMWDLQLDPLKYEDLVALWEKMPDDYGK